MRTVTSNCLADKFGGRLEISTICLGGWLRGYNRRPLPMQKTLNLSTWSNNSTDTILTKDIGLVTFRLFGMGGGREDFQILFDVWVTFFCVFFSHPIPHPKVFKIYQNHTKKSKKNALIIFTCPT